MNITTEQIFDDAHTPQGWLVDPVSEETLRRLWETMKWAPTSANTQPARIVFCRSTEARKKLADCCSAGNVDKVKAAPVTAIIGMDMEFHEKLPQQFPQTDARSWFVGKPDFIASTAFRNSTLQGAYLILAARALGLDCGPMSGFDNAKVDEAFFAGTKVRSNFICSLGKGDPAKIWPRNPRLTFEEACRVE